MKSIKLRKYTILASIMLTASMLLAGCGKSTSNTNDPKNVKTVAVSTTSIENYTEYGSTLQPQNEISVSPKISGKVESMNVDVGQQVKAGDVLFTLDSSELQAQYNQAAASLSSAQANLTRTSDSQFKQQLVDAQASQSSAQNTYDDAKRSFDKTKALYDAGASPEQDLDNAQTKLNAAETQLKSANDSLNILNGNGELQTEAVAQAQVNQAQAAVGLAQAQLNDATIKAPSDGVVSEKDADVGEMVSSSKSVISIEDNGYFIGEINISSKDLSGITVGQKVTVKVTSLQDKSFDGIIDTISPSANSTTQLYDVKVKIPDNDDSLKAGMVIKISLPNEEKDNVMVVPNEAILADNGMEYVYAVEDGIVKKITVSVGISDGNNTEITDGLKPGDNVIIEGQSFLSDGDKVNISKS